MAVEQRVTDILAQYGEVVEGNVWTVQSATVIYHKTVERMAVRAGIVFEEPTVLRAERDEAVILVRGKLGDRWDYDLGEALVNVNYRISGRQAAYVYAMALKRGRDRLILKLIGLHGLLYSEAEADDFASEAPPVDALLPPRQRLSPPSQQAASQEAVTTGRDIDMGDGVLSLSSVIERRLENLKKRVLGFKDPDKLEELLFSTAAVETLNVVDPEEAGAIRATALRRIREMREEGIRP
jgi:hypothetical protein